MNGLLFGHTYNIYIISVVIALQEEMSVEDTDNEKKCSCVKEKAIDTLNVRKRSILKSPSDSTVITGRCIIQRVR